MMPEKPVRGFPLFSKPEGIGEGTGDDGEGGYQEEIEEGQDDLRLEISDSSREDLPRYPEPRQKLSHDRSLKEGIDEGRKD